ncbi:Serine-threonine protein kinase [Entamoeba marina]
MDKDSPRTKKSKRTTTSPREIKIKLRKANFSLTQPTSPNLGSRFSISEEKLMLDSPRISDAPCNTKTFFGIPMVIDASIRYLINCFTDGSKFTKSVYEWSNDEMLEMLQSENLLEFDNLLRHNTVTVKDLLNFQRHDFLRVGLSIFQTHRIQHVFDQLKCFPSFFHNINNGSIFNSSDTQRALNLLNKYKNGQQVSLYQESTPFVVILLIKYYFTNNPFPFLCEKLIEEIEVILQSHKKGSLLEPLSTINEKDIRMLIREYLDNDEAVVLQKLIEMIVEITHNSTTEEQTELFNFIFDCLSVNYSFGERLPLLINFLYSSNKFEKLVLFDSEDVYDGEIVKCVIQNVRCPLSVISSPVKPGEVSIPGRLAVTNYRIMFIPTVKLDVQRRALLGRIGQCPLKNIVNREVIQLGGHSTEYVMRILTTTYFVLSFFSYENVFDSVESAINEVLFDGILNVNRTAEIGHATSFDNIFKLETERLMISNPIFNIDETVIPFGAPLFVTPLLCAEDPKRKFVISYRHVESNSMLIRFSLSLLHVNNSFLTLQREDKKYFKVIETNLLGVETVKKTFAELQDYCTFSKESPNYRLYTEKVGKVNTFVNVIMKTTNSIISTLLKENTNVLLLPKNLKEMDVGIFSCIVQLLCDSFYRTTFGFIRLLQKELTLFKFDFSSSRFVFTIFIVVLLLLNKQFPSLFQFNETFILFVHHHSTSRLFKDFNTYDASSLVHFVNLHREDFSNAHYKEIKGVFSPSTFTTHVCNEMFYQIRTYSPQIIAKFLQTIHNNQFEAPSLSIYFFPLQKSFPVLNNLTLLDLSHNELVNFPTEIAQCISLKQLNLSHNKLITISDVVSSLQNLTYLDLSNNTISSLPQSIISINLIFLDISENEIQKSSQLFLPTTLQSLCLRSVFFFPSISNVHLTYLDISNTVGVEDSMLYSLPPISLLELSLSNCKLTQLTKLDLSGNTLKSLPPFFFSLTNLKSIDLTKNSLPQISVMFSKLVSLTQIQLDQTVGIPYSLKSLFPTRASKDKSTKKINDDPVNIILTGDIAKKKCGKDKDVQHYSFSLEKNIIITETPYELIEENPFKVNKNVVYVICRRVTKAKTNAIPFSRLLDFLQLTNNKQPIVCINVKTNDNELVDKDSNIRQELESNYSSLSITYFDYFVNGKEKQVKDLLKLIKTISDQVRTSVPQIISKFIEELQYVDLHPGVVETDNLKLLMDGLSIDKQQQENVLSILQKLQISFSFPPYYSPTFGCYTTFYLNSNRHRNQFTLLSFSLPDVITQQLLKTQTETGIILPDLFLHHFQFLSLEQQDYLLTVLEYYHIIFVLRKPFFESLELSEEFDYLLHSYLSSDSTTNLNTNSPQKQPSSKSLTDSITLGTIHSLSSNSINPSHIKKTSTFIKRHIRTPRLQLNDDTQPHSQYIVSPRSSRMDIYDKRPITNKVLVLNYCGLSQEKFEWGKSTPNEMEIGRCYRLNRLPTQIGMMLISILSVKYSLTKAWKTGLLASITTTTNKYQLFVEWDFDKLRIVYKIRFTIKNIESFLDTGKIWNDITLITGSVFKYFPQVNFTYDILCPHCIKDGQKIDECYCIDEDDILTTIGCGLYVDSYAKHTIQFAVNCWDILSNVLSFKQHEIANENLTLIETLKRGSSSKVNLCNLKGREQPVVVKQLEMDLEGMLMNGDDCVDYYTERVDDFLRETEFADFPVSPNIAKVIGFSLNPLGIIMEYFNGGNLFDYIANTTTIPWKDRISIALNVAKGMVFLNSQQNPIIHRDLKSPNVILKVDSEKNITQVAITDFGQSVPISVLNYKNSHCVECPFWLAPEAIITQNYEIESDIYSFGMILWELSTLSAPFPQFNFMEEVREFVKSGKLQKIPQSPYPEFDALIQDCWKPYKERPAFASIVRGYCLGIDKEPHLVKLGDITQLQNLSVEYGVSFETLPISLQTINYSGNRLNKEISKSTYSLSKLTNIESLKIPMNFIKDILSLSKLSSLTLSNYIDSRSKEMDESQLIDLSGLTNIKNMEIYTYWNPITLPTSLTSFFVGFGYWKKGLKEIDIDYLNHLEVLQLRNTTKIVSLPTTLTNFQLYVSKPFELDLTNIPLKKFVFSRHKMDKDDSVMKFIKLPSTLEHFSYAADPDEGIMFDINHLKNLKVFDLNFEDRYNQPTIDLGELNLPSTLEKFCCTKDKATKLKFKNTENTQLPKLIKEKLMKNRKI